jgi:hypothetical protein
MSISMRRPAIGGGMIVHRTVVHLLGRDLDSTVPVGWPVRDDYLRWRKFVSVCRSLHRDGLDYIVTVEPHNKRILIGAAGCVRPRKPAKPSYPVPDPPDEAQARKALESAVRALVLCKDRLAGEWSWWRAGQGRPCCDVVVRETRQRFGRWLASCLARRPRGFRDLASFVPNLSDYKSGDECFGRKLPRLSKLPKSELERQGWVKTVAQGTFGIWWKWRPGREAGSQDPPNPDMDETPSLTQPEWVTKFLAGQRGREEPPALRRYQEAKAEAEYWREILRLLEERRNGNQRQA